MATRSKHAAILLAAAALFAAACSLQLPDEGELSGGGAGSAEGGSPPAPVPGQTPPATGAPSTPQDGGDGSAPSETIACGGNGQGGNHRHLYRRTGNDITLLEECAWGCTWTAGAASDRCRSRNEGCIYGFGDYCGENGVPGDPTVLYHCSNDVSIAVKRCENGCVRAPPNVDDYCGP